MELIVAREIDAPAQRVWDVITDLDGAPEVLSGVERVERLDGADGFDVGTRWRETRTMFGRQTSEDMAITAIEPPRRYTVVADSSGTTYTSTFEVAPLEDHRCRLTMGFGARSAGLAGRLLAATVGRLFLGATRKALERDLDDIAAAAEARTT